MVFLLQMIALEINVVTYIVIHSMSRTSCLLLKDHLQTFCINYLKKLFFQRGFWYQNCSFVFLVWNFLSDAISLITNKRHYLFFLYLTFYPNKEPQQHSYRLCRSTRKLLMALQWPEVIVYSYIPRSVQKVSSHARSKRETFIKEGTRNIVHRTMMPQSPSKCRHLWTSEFSQHLFHCSKCSAKSFVGITISCPIVFSCMSLMVWNLFPFKGGFNFGKSHKSQSAKSEL